ncbi:hypothetical protein TcWFU_008588 [Taenia crassiceps]|uniref:Uncharacterized protein n=1 Tax=Taenia crassiceps TaxID=6207 RepID=A0ABR4QFK4_9CEST
MNNAETLQKSPHSKSAGPEWNRLLTHFHICYPADAVDDVTISSALVLLLLTLVCHAPSSRADFLGYYLDYFNLRDKYIPFINDDVESVNRHKELKRKAREGLALHFERQRKKMEKKYEL